ncbi:MAG TPA: ribbon-helix-helix protein, CopG family [Dehalococcoidia bacterium]|nr:ribbon-helix-helix protein, CopG family [Dehalococcoidia bacterium]
MSKRLTITLPDDLAADLRHEAAATRKPVSRIVAQAIVTRKEQFTRQLMAKGYREMAAEGRKMAEESLTAALETWPGD